MLPGLGLPIMGMGLVTLAARVGAYDVARQRIRQHGLPRFVAAALLSGYLWMAVAGVLAAPGTPSSRRQVARPAG